MLLHLNQRITNRKNAALSLDVKANVISLLDTGAGQDPKAQRSSMRLAAKIEAAHDSIELTDAESKLIHACLDGYPNLQGWARIVMENTFWPDEQSESDLEDFKARYAVEAVAAPVSNGNGIAKEA